MSTKFDSRLDKLEEKLTAAGQLPKEARGPHIRWWDIGAEKPDFAEIKADLLERFGTINGADFTVIGWQRPDGDGISVDPIEGR